MTTILKQMGVQQWRLRQPNQSALSLLELGSVQSLSSEHSSQATPVSDLCFATADQASSDSVTRSIGNVSASDSSFTKADNEIESRISIKPLPVVETARAVASLPAAKPEASAMAMPTVTAMPVSSLRQAPPNLANQKHDQVAEPDQASAPVMPSSIEELDWQGLQQLVNKQSQCQSCGPVNSILGSGDHKADWLFVTDAPTSTDLVSQQFFSGRAGQLYQAMLLAVGLTRESVYTTSVFKCATSDDISVIPSCETLLLRQIELVQPKVVIAFGEFAAQSVAKSNEGLESLRSQVLRCYQTKVPIVASYSLSQLLEQPDLKAGAWQDLKKCLAITH